MPSSRRVGLLTRSVLPLVLLSVGACSSGEPGEESTEKELTVSATTGSDSAVDGVSANVIPTADLSSSVVVAGQVLQGGVADAEPVATIAETQSASLGEVDDVDAEPIAPSVEPPSITAVAASELEPDSSASSPPLGAASTDQETVGDTPSSSNVIEVEVDEEAASGSTIIVGNGPGDASCLRLPSTASGFGSISQNDWSSWVDDVRFSIGTSHLELPGETNGYRALRQKFVPASNGTARVITAANLPEARTYRLVQSVMFEDGWDWGGESSQGGKIGFGLSGGTSPTGGAIDHAGFSARMIWRGNRDGTARMAIYSYAADRPGTYGEDVYLGEFLAPIGEWFDLAMEIQTNSNIDEADGRMRAWVNGELLLDRSNVAWQTEGGTPSVDNLYYSTFYGGNSSAWSPDRTTHAQIRDVCWSPVVDGYSGIDPDAGRIQAPTQAELYALLNDVSIPFASAESRRTRILGKLEGVSAELTEMLDDDSPFVGATLREAVDSVNDAANPSHWLSQTTLDPLAPTLLNLDFAVHSLANAIDIRKSVGDSASLEQMVLTDMRDLIAEIVDGLISQASATVSEHNCEVAQTSDCSYASQYLAEAIDARLFMSISDDDTRRFTTQAESVWSLAVRAINALP